MILLLSLVYARSLAQNHTLFCLLVFTAVYLDSLEDDDKIRMGVQAGSPWKSALSRGPNRYTHEALFPDGVCWDKAVKSQPGRGLCTYHYRSPCLLKGMAPPENGMSVSPQSHNLTFSVISSVQI